MREKDGSSVPVDWNKFNAVDRTSQMQRNLGLEVLSCFVLVLAHIHSQNKKRVTKYRSPKIKILDFNHLQNKDFGVTV